MVSFWVADFAINAAALPCRALATDVVPARLQNECNSGFSIMVRARGGEVGGERKEGRGRGNVRRGTGEDRKRGRKRGRGRE